MPSNIKKVFSRGFEADIKVNTNNLIFNTNYSFTKSTNDNDTENLDYTSGEQLRYVPLHKGNVSLTLIDKNIHLTLNKMYTGKVITSYAFPENKTLDSFLLTDLSCKYILTNYQISILLKVKNLFNKSYVTYLNYPNPGREYLLTINYNMN
tara:strand:- start:46 stop:498 length:453 start_codon:yes stop_codon:yes gene_type:complete